MADMDEQPAVDFFIAHASADREYAERLYALLAPLSTRGRWLSASRGMTSCKPPSAGLASPSPPPCRSSRWFLRAYLGTADDPEPFEGRAAVLASPPCRASLGASMPETTLVEAGPFHGAACSFTGAAVRRHR